MLFMQESIRTNKVSAQLRSTPPNVIFLTAILVIRFILQRSISAFVGNQLVTMGIRQVDR